MAFFCYSFVPLVPYCYVKIYQYRKKQKKLGIKQEELKYRLGLRKSFNKKESLMKENQKHCNIPVKYDRVGAGYNHHALGENNKA